MSVEVISSPFKLGWARNRNTYRLHCLDRQLSPGVATLIRYTFGGAMPDVGCSVVIAVDGAEYAFQVVETPSGNAYEVATVAEIGAKMAACWHLNQIFYCQGNAADATMSKYINLTGLVAGKHDVDVYVTDADGMRIESSLAINRTLNREGSDPVNKPRYAVAVEVTAVVNNSNLLTTHKTGSMMFYPDGEGYVDVPLDLLAGVIPQPDVPNTNASASDWMLLTNALMKYRVSYGEVWGEGKPMVQNWATLPSSDGWNYAICGEEADRFARLNLPDWRSGETQFSEANNIFWIIGEDDTLTVRVCRNQAEYLYGLWFDQTQSMGGNPATRTVSMTVVAGGVTTTSSHTVKNGEVYRIPVGPTALNIAAPCYTVRFTVDTYSWERTYIVQPDFYNPTHLLLQSKYGLVRSFVVPEVRRDITTEAEVLNADRRRYLDMTENGESYIATTAPITRTEARRMAQCLTGEYHYVRCGTAWLRITIEPGSFTVLDDGEDMVRVELTYRFVENQTENITDGTLGRGATATVVDFDSHVVAFSDRTIPNHNDIL